MAVTLNNRALVTIYGGSGFVGRHVVRAIAKTGARMRVAVRRPELAGHLQPLGGVGQISLVQANVRFPESLIAPSRDADAVVNLVGILFPTGKQTFKAVQDEGARHVAEAAWAAGANVLVHVSAIGANAEAKSVYARTKAEGERAVREIFPQAVILRPSIVFGPEDHFFNRFAALARALPALPLIGGGKTRLQPVFAGDVAKEKADFMANSQVPLPFWLAKLQGALLQLLPNPMLTLDQVRLVQSDSVVSEEATRERRTLEGLGIEPVAVASVVPDYLEQFRPRGQFSIYRP